jgi:hypothetical protein
MESRPIEMAYFQAYSRGDSMNFFPLVGNLSRKAPDMSDMPNESVVKCMIFPRRDLA